jgi:UDP-glucuronate 4-epimerase
MTYMYIYIKEWHSQDGTPEIFNLGNQSPVPLLDFVKTIEKHMGKKAIIVDGGESKGEVMTTSSDVSLANKILGFEPKVDIDEGIRQFAEWYLSSDRKPEYSTVSS